MIYERNETVKTVTWQFWSNLFVGQSFEWQTCYEEQIVKYALESFCIMKQESQLRDQYPRQRTEH